MMVPAGYLLMSIVRCGRRRSGGGGRRCRHRR